MNRPASLAALAIVCLVAAGLRVQGLHWDANRWTPPGKTAEEWREHHLHPDERFLTMVTQRVALPEGFRQYLDTSTSPLNPNNQGFGFFVYGTFPVQLVKAASAALGMDDYWHIHIVGRLLSAAFDVVTVVLCWVLGRRLFGDAVGVGGALLYALAVLPIQQAHFYTVDSIATTFVAATLVAADWLRRRDGLLAYTLAGFALGIATACKLSSAPVVVAVVAACAVRAWHHRRDGRRLTLGLLGALWSAVVALLAFRVLLPYAFAERGLLDFALDPEWIADVRSLGSSSSGEVDYPPGYQWAGRIPLWFPWKNMVLAGMGPALGIAAWEGWALAGWEMVRRRRAEHLVPWLWIAIAFAYFGTRWVMTMRYFLPLYPALCVYAAWLVARVARTRADPATALRTEGGVRWTSPAVMLAVAVVAGTALWAAAFSAIYWRPHSRIEASRWIWEHVPRDATLAVEHWDDPLPLSLDARRAQDHFRFVQLTNYYDDSPQKLDDLIDALDRTDYVVLSSNRLLGSLTRLRGRYPMTSRYYRALLSGQLGFAPAADVTSYPALGPLAISDDAIEEAFTVYDHPRARVFRKTEGWDPVAARELLGAVNWDTIDRAPPRDLRPTD